MPIDVSIVLGALVGALGAYIVARVNRDEARRAREDTKQARADDRADARHARFADRKLSLATDLLIAADIHSREARQQVASKAVARAWAEEGFEPEEGHGIPSVGTTEAVRRAYQAIDLVAPAIAGAAARLYEATVPLGSLAARADQDLPEDKWAREWQEAIERYDAAVFVFVDAVRADLRVREEASATRS